MRFSYDKQFEQYLEKKNLTARGCNFFEHVRRVSKPILKSNRNQSFSALLKRYETTESCVARIRNGPTMMSDLYVQECLPPCVHVSVHQESIHVRFTASLNFPNFTLNSVWTYGQCSWRIFSQ